MVRGLAHQPTGFVRQALKCLEGAGDLVVRRILLIDAPTVLGWRRWRDIGEQTGLGMLREVLSDPGAGRLLDCAAATGPG